MAILLNDNLDIAANKPVDNRYGPYSTVAAAIAAIPSFKRHIGLTVGIGLTNTVDYWFKAGTGDTDLIEKVPTVNVPVTSVAGKTGAVTLVKGDVGLSNVDNTSDADKPVSNPTQTALNAKQNTLVSGTNIKTINNESILGAGNITISAGGTQVNADWTETNTASTAFILNKPTLGTAASQNVGTAAGNVVQLQNVGGVAKLPALDGSQLTNLPVSAGSTNLSYTASATGGTVVSDTGSDATLSLADTTNAGLMSPADKTKLNSVASGAEVNVQANWTETNNTSDAFILNKPTTFPPSAHTHVISDVTGLSSALTAKQDTLSSGTNIKTINGTSLLGAGDISIGSGGTQVNSDWNATTGVEQILNKPTAFPPTAHTHDFTEISSWYGNDNIGDDIAGLDQTVGDLSTQLGSKEEAWQYPAQISLIATTAEETVLSQLSRYVDRFVTNTSGTTKILTLPVTNVITNGLYRLRVLDTSTSPITIRRRNWTTTGTGDQYTVLATATAGQKFTFRATSTNQNSWVVENVDTHTHSLNSLTQSGATTGQVIKWNGTNWAPGDDTGGSGGVSLLNYTASPTGGSLTADSQNVSLSLADTTNAGLMSPADKTKLNGLNGPYATLENGKVPESQLPSYVDDVLEYATQGNRPNPGETGKIYVTLDDNKCWRWTGSTYIEISPSSGQISAVAGLQEALNGKQTTIFNQATIPVTANNQTFLVSSYYPNNNGADLRRTITTIAFAQAVTGGTTVIRLPQWLSTGLGAWRGDQAFFKFQVPPGVTLQFQWHNGTSWVEMAKFYFSGSEYWSAYQATIETGTYVIWDRFSTLYGVRDLFTPRLGHFILDSEVQSHTLEANNVYSISTYSITNYGLSLPVPVRQGDRIIVRHSGAGTGTLSFTTQAAQLLATYTGERQGGQTNNPQIEFLCTLVGGALAWQDVTPNGVVRSVAGKTGTVTINVSDLTQSNATTGQVIKWNGTVWIPSTDSGVTLPEPKVVLRDIDSSPAQRVYSLDMTTFIQGTQLPLSTVPFVVVQDIPTEQVENLDIFLECVILGKKNKVSQTASYVAPSPWDVTVTGDPSQGETVTVTQNWTHPWPINHRSRTGKHNVKNLSTGVHTLIGMDRPNHFAVNALYDVVPIYKFLNGRFITRDVRYRTASENGSGEFTMTEPLFTPLTSKQNTLTIGKRYPYSSAFAPLRIACRYVVWDPAKTAFITGPLSKTMKIWYAPFPFNIDHVASSMLGLPVCKLNPSYQQSPSMKVWIE